MKQKRAKRKLSAIFSADVKGYSRLMGDDELATVETLKEYRELMGTLKKRSDCLKKRYAWTLFTRKRPIYVWRGPISI